MGEETEFTRDGDTLSIAGEIDVAVVREFDSALNSLIDAHPGSTVSVDMQAVGFIDSSGLGVLVGALKRASDSGGSVVLCNLQDSPRKVFEITGLRAMFGID